MINCVWADGLPQIHIQPDGVIEITAAHTIAYGVIDKIDLSKQSASTEDPIPTDVRHIYMDEHYGWVDADVYDGNTLMTGMELVGPAIIEERTTTVCIGPHDRLTVDEYGNYVVQLTAASRSNT